MEQNEINESITMQKTENQIIFYGRDIGIIAGYLYQCKGNTILSELTKCGIISKPKHRKVFIGNLKVGDVVLLESGIYDYDQVIFEIADVINVNPLTIRIRSDKDTDIYNALGVCNGFMIEEKSVDQMTIEYFKHLILTISTNNEYASCISGTINNRKIQETKNKNAHIIAEVSDETIANLIVKTFNNPTNSQAKSTALYNPVVLAYESGNIIATNGMSEFDRNSIRMYVLGFKNALNVVD